MTTRRDRIAAALPDGTDPALIDRLAGLPAAEVTAITAALRAAHRAGRDHEVQVRRTRRENRQRYMRPDDEQVSATTQAMITRQAGRASESLDAFAYLVQLFDNSRPILQTAAEGLLAQGYSWTDIGDAVGTRRMSAWKRFARKPEANGTDAPAGGPDL